MRAILAAILTLATAESAAALDEVVVQRDAVQQTLRGKVLVKAADGGLLLQAPDGRLWRIEPQQIVAQSTDRLPFQPLSADELASRLPGELGAGFEVHRTAHYLIAHNTSREYAAWCGALLERLYQGFTAFWEHKDFPLHAPEFPLVAVVFRDQASYAAHAKAELGRATAAVIGYYSLETNRVTMYDLTGALAQQRPGARVSVAQINQLLQGDAERTVATVIHEATHQLAYNSGLHTRFADVPMWVSEGLAVYFETPDLRSAKGWRSIGVVNRPRLARFQDYLARRPDDSLAALVQDDARLRDTRSGLDAYAEAWALNYFLLRQRPKQYAGYLKLLSAKPPLVWDDPATRLAEFRAAFAADPAQLDAELLRYLQRVR